MDASFLISVDAEQSLVRIRMSGFFSPKDIARFTAERDAAHLQLRCGPNQHVTLVDIRGMQIQLQGSVAEFQKVLSNPRTAGKRIGFVVAQSLARHQLRRAADGRVAEFFTSEDEALRWLTSA